MLVGFSMDSCTMAHLRKENGKNQRQAVEEFRITLKTSDGNLVMNRNGENDCWLRRNGEIDHDFAKFSLEIDCREKGVKLLGYKKVPSGISALVVWK